MAFGASENTIEYSVSYMNIYALGTIFVQLTLGMNAFITACGFAKTGMLSVLIGAVTNIILDPIFIFGMNMGVRGGALATVLSRGSLLHLGSCLFDGQKRSCVCVSTGSASRKPLSFPALDSAPPPSLCRAAKALFLYALTPLF